MRIARLLSRNSGFSLVELSIVLVILGLLTGGILAGQSLIRAAEMRNVTVEYNRYYSASQSFRDKYFAVPGDMNNATKFWGVLNATPATCAVTPSTDMLTCDGTGDGIVYAPTPGSNEMFRYWQHLANAGLIEGTYSGVSSPANPQGAGVDVGINVPASRISNAGWSVLRIDPPTVPTQVFDSASNYGNAFFFGTKFFFTTGGALTPEEAWNVDTKIDDGKPTKGRALSWKNLVTPGCVVDDTETTDWAFANKAKACALIIRQVL